HQPGIVLVPKVESARDIEVVAGALDTDQHAPVIYALIETPRAIDWLPTIVTADRLGGLLFGAADYAALTGCARTWEALLYARSAVANNAGTACIPAIDSPYFDVRDLEGLRREAERARALGFQGKGAVHPRRIPVITQAFTPSDDEIAAPRPSAARWSARPWSPPPKPSSTMLPRPRHPPPADEEATHEHEHRHHDPAGLPGGRQGPLQGERRSRAHRLRRRPDLRAPARRTVTETDHVLNLALTGNVAPIHSDIEFCEHLGRRPWGG
ncbi:aldolase/citrate lyase family protein, partial [Streptomyces sp. B21-106]